MATIILLHGRFVQVQVMTTHAKFEAAALDIYMPARRSRLPPPKAAGGCDVALTVARGCHAAQRRNLQGTVKRLVNQDCHLWYDEHLY
jgi:hypothetical protein